MRRLILIARREYVAYVRTVGFWLSMLLVPVLIVFGGALPLLVERAEPVRHIALTDLTAQGLGGAFRQALAKSEKDAAIRMMALAAAGRGGPAAADSIREAGRTDGLEGARMRLSALDPDAGRRWAPPKSKMVWTEAPGSLAAAKTLEGADQAARQLVSGDKGELDAVVLLYDGKDGPAARIWSRSAGPDAIEDTVKGALEATDRAQALRGLGLDPARVEALESRKPEVEVRSPRSVGEGAKVGLRDRLPMIVGLASGFLLWTLIITAASILMNSVIEEKSNRVLEVLLSSADTVEIMGGKVLGVALVSLTVMGMWIGIAALGLTSAAPGWMTDLRAVLGDPLIWVRLGANFLFGYLMYGAVFAAIGAWCETPREAQTLLGPVMLLLMIPLFAMQFAIRTPDLPLLKILSWIPFFTPFLMSLRAAAHPPAYETAASLGLMALAAAAMLWVGGKAFRTGALSTGKPSLAALFGLKRAGG